MPFMYAKTQKPISKTATINSIQKKFRPKNGALYRPISQRRFVSIFELFFIIIFPHNLPKQDLSLLMPQTRATIHITKYLTLSVQ